MISFGWRRLFHQTWHPSFEELMLDLDGELGPKRAKMEAHLKSCWSCRLRREKIDRVISTFMDTRNASFGDSPKFPPQALSRFEAKLDRLDSESGSPPSFSGLIRLQMRELFLSRRPLRLATFLVSFILILLVLVRLSSVPPVSAKEVLSRAKQAEAQRMLQVPAPVIYEKLQLRRRSAANPVETITWEIWNDTRNNRLRQRVTDPEGLRFLPVNSYGAPTVFGQSEGAEDSVPALPVAASSVQAQAPLPPVLAELEQVFRTHQADFGRPLSPANYEAWRHSIREKSEKVWEGKLPNGDKAMILQASGQGPFLPNAIVSAEFTVRQRDWHPLEQRLQVQKEDGIVDYALGQVAFSVIAANALPPSIFADPVALAPAAIPHLLVPLQVPIPAITAMLPAEADLLAAEVEAWYALHSVGACMGRPISVARTGLNQIEVQGVVETEEIETQVLVALRGIPHVTSKIRTAAEDWSISSLSGEETGEVSTSDSGQPAGAEAPSRELVTEDLLKQYFAAGSCAKGPDESKAECIQQKIAELSRQAVSRSESAQEQAWALRQLAQWYPLLKRDELRTSTLRLLELMVRDHMNALKQELDKSRLLVEPILTSLLGDASVASESMRGESVSPPDLENADWPAASLHLCASVERAVSLTLSLFAETNLPVTQREEAMQYLRSTFGTLDGELQRLGADVAIELSDIPKAMTSKSKPEEE